MSATSTLQHFSKTVENCQHAELFIPFLVRGKLIICGNTFEFEFEGASIATVADTIRKVGAAGFILTVDPDIESDQNTDSVSILRVPGIALNNIQYSVVYHTIFLFKVIIVI